jgi:hypothetical protein
VKLDSNLICSYNKGYSALIKEKISCAQKIKHYTMKTYGGIDIEIHILLSSALVGSERSATRTCHFTPGEITPGTYCIGVWVGPMAGLDDMVKRKILPRAPTS